ncbi:tyrosine-type recombinase/integrase [Brevibacillus thermoruber]|uniref:tyrosine-type recombinase/integrase n=1 Tax=Brevibacillus thermoruber TaxID=33942 RepID=UPI00068ED72D|nr:tyrosine-type recombinase/integrase [Brevibacillus thermoruber]
MDRRKGRTLVRKRPSVDLHQHDLTLDQLFERFYSFKTSQGLRDRTLSEHRKLYGYFRDWLQQKIPHPKVGDITRETVQAYITYMAQERVHYEGHTFNPAKNAPEVKVGLSPMTINIRLRALKCFLKYGYDHGYFEENPIAGIKLFKTDEDEIGSFTEQQVQKLLKACDRKTYAGFRDYTLMTLLLDTGLRISEALSITNEMVDCNARLITLSGKVTKNRKLRQVPISQETAKLIKQLQQDNTHFFHPDIPFTIFKGDNLLES